MSAINTKDHLLKLINDNCDDVHRFVEMSKTIDCVLTHTKGLWQEASYCYKAKEIAERMVNETRRFQQEANHHNTHKMLDTVYVRFCRLVDEYHALQQQQLSDGLALQQMLQVSNMELAA
jgi:hypothetical protein